MQTFASQFKLVKRRYTRVGSCKHSEDVTCCITGITIRIIQSESRRCTRSTPNTSSLQFCNVHPTCAGQRLLTETLPTYFRGYVLVGLLLLMWCVVRPASPGQTKVVKVNLSSSIADMLRASLPTS